MPHNDEMPAGLSTYEAKRWQEIQKWKLQSAKAGVVRLPAPVRGAVEGAQAKLAEGWHSVPGNDAVELWIAKAINGGFHLTIDLLSKTVDEPKILQRVSKRGELVGSLDEFVSLDLQVLDRAAPHQKMLRSAAAAGHGAVSGFFAGGATAAGAATGGMGALPAAGAIAGLAVLDAAALVTNMVQASALIGAHYGFDPRKAEEHTMLMSVLGAGIAREGAKTVAMMRVRELALMLAAKRTIAQLSQKQLFNLMRRVYALLLLKTAKRNIAKGLPVAGILIGGGINYGSVRNLVEAAEHLYPERFLFTKYSESTDDGSLLTLDELFAEEEDVDETDKGILDHLDELPAIREGMKEDGGDQDSPA